MSSGSAAPAILDECWEWNGTRSKGYGLKHFRGRQQKTHRIAYEWANGPIPNGMNVLHKCDNPPCCNPDHLYLGTQKENVKDMVERRRMAPQQKTHCPKGHELAEGNLVRYKLKQGVRECAACKRESGRKRAERLRRAAGVKKKKPRASHGDEPASWADLADIWQPVGISA